MGSSAPLQHSDHRRRMSDHKWSTSDQKSVERTRIIWCIYAIGFMDMFGVSMVIPLFGHHVRGLGASPTAAGILASVYGVLQLFSSTIIGSWSDVVGRRYSLLTCLLVSAMGYFLLSMSTSITLFVLARIPVGLFKHSLSICRALLSDLVTGSERAVVMGYFSTASSLGFILGPVVSGYLSEHEGGFYTSSFTCASIFILNAGLVWMLPQTKTLPHSKGTTSNNGFQEVCCGTNCSTTVSNGSANGSSHSLEAEKKASLLLPALKKISSIGTNIRTVICSDLWDLFLVRLLMAIAILLFHSNFSLALGERFSLRPKEAGYLISYSNTLGALSGFVVGPVIRLYRNNISALLLHSTVLTCTFIFLYASAVSVWQVLISSTFISVSITVGRMCITHLELQRGGDQASGTLIGAEQSVTAVGRVLAHVLSGLSQEFSPCGPPTVGVVMSLTAVFVLLIRIPKWNKRGMTKMD